MSVPVGPGDGSHTPQPLATASIARAGLAALAVHVAVLAYANFLLYQQFLGRTLVDLQAPLRAAFTAYTFRVLAAESAMLAAAAAGVAIVQRIAPTHVDEGRLAATGLLSYGAVSIYGVAIVLATAVGWEPDVFVMSAFDATDAETAAAIAEALPYVLQPLAWGRLAASVASAALFAILQVRLCGQPATRAIATAAAAAACAAAGQIAMLGLPAM